MIIPALLLFSLGIVVIYSSSGVLALQQILFGLVGLMIVFSLRFFDYRLLRSILKPAYFLVTVLLLVTFFLGSETRGSIRWIPLGPFNFQPSEFAKPILILSLAAFWSKHLPSWKSVLKSILIFLPLAVLIFEQPDLGTALTVMFIWMVMLLAANISFKKLLMLSLVGLIILPVGWFLLHDYQRERFVSFLYPAKDPLGVGYNVIQSTIAVGSGELFGRGLGRGTQSRLQFLPEFRTDFIFATMAEELGLFGSLIILILYGVLFGMLFKLLFKLNDQFGELILIGVMSMLFFQTGVNMGMNLGLLPITGITLPLLSYGGSSLITTFLCLGLAFSVKRYGVKKREEVDRE